MSHLPFPNQDAGVGAARPFRKITLDVDGVETAAPSAPVYEWSRMRNGQPRLIVSAPSHAPGALRTLAGRLAEPLFLLYVLHTPRGEGLPGRYQSPPLDRGRVDAFLTAYAAFLAGDARHDVWIHSAGDGRTLVWDRHDLMFVEGAPLDEFAEVMETMGFTRGPVPRTGAGPHLHHSRPEFDIDAAAVLAHFEWARTDLRPEDQQ